MLQKKGLKMFPEKNRTRTSKYRMAIIAPGSLPVPAIEGGAVENLIDVFLKDIYQNTMYEVDVFSVSDNLAAERVYCDINITYYQFPKKNVRYSILNRIIWKFLPWLRYSWYLNPVLNIIKKSINNYDVILVENQVQFMPVIKRVAHCPVCLHLHNKDWRIPSWACRNLAKQADLILAVSEFVKNYVKQWHPQANVKVVHNGINTNIFIPQENNIRNEIRKKYGISQDAFVIGYAGRLCLEKGVRELLDAFIQFPKSQNLCLLIMGSSWFGKTIDDHFIEELKTIAQKSCNPIIFTGYLLNKDVALIESALDLMVVPSLCDDAFPLSVLEAMSCGLPIIATKSGGIPEAVNEECAFVVERDEKLSDNIKNYIDFLSGNPSVCIKMGCEARIHAQKNFSAECYVEKMKKAIFAELIEDSQK